VYNTALLINADCRTIDALHYITKEFNPANVDLLSYEDDTDSWLRKLFESNLIRLFIKIFLNAHA